MSAEIERIRGALRGRRLQVLAAELGVPIPTLEQFVCGRAGLAPALLTGLTRILNKNIPAPIPRNIMRLNARTLKCTAVLAASELVDPGSSARVALEVNVGGRIFTADVASKSVRKCKATIAEHGVDEPVLLIQAGLRAMRSSKLASSCR